MNDKARELEMAHHSYGYGRWDAKYWFIGPEEGKGTKEDGDNAHRVDAWFELNQDGLSDCRKFHHSIGEHNWHKENPKLQRTWRPLILLLKTFLNEPSGQGDLRAYQREEWGRSDGETCAIELSGRAARSLKEPIARKQFLQDRIEFIRQKMHEHKPKFIVMYGVGERANFEMIAGCHLIRDSVVKAGPIVIAFAPHPNTRGRKDADWEELGSKLRNEQAAHNSD